MASHLLGALCILWSNCRYYFNFTDDKLRLIEIRQRPQSHTTLGLPKGLCAYIGEKSWPMESSARRIARGSNPVVPNCDSALFPQCFRTWILLPHHLLKFLKSSNILRLFVFFLPSLLNLETLVWLYDPRLTLLTAALSHLVLSCMSVVQIPFNLQLSWEHFEASMRLLHICGLSHSHQQSSRSYMIWNCLPTCSANLGFRIWMTTLQFFPVGFLKGPTSNTTLTSP